MSVWLFFKTPNPPRGTSDVTTLKEQFIKNKYIFKSNYFWLIVGVVCFAYGTKIAFLNLWAAVWLHTVVGLSISQVASHLFVASIALVVGDLGWGAISERMGVYIKHSVEWCIVVGAIFFIVMQVLVMLQIADVKSYWPWFMFGFFSRYTTLGYAALAQHFDKNLLGSSATAINACFYLSAFVTQLCMGIHQEYHITFRVLISLQVLGLMAFAMPKLVNFLNLR
jgi:hypothetical protein